MAIAFHDKLSPMPDALSTARRSLKKVNRARSSSFRSKLVLIPVCSAALVASIVVASAQTGGAPPDRTTAIFKAARTGDLDALKQLIGNGPVDIKMADGATPLFDAAMAGQINVLTWLLDKGANVNSALPDGTTALHLAIAQKQFDASRIFVGHKANLNVAIKKPDSRLTPLLLAIDRKTKDIALLLINSGADVNLPLGRGYVPDYPLEQAAWPNPGDWPGQEDVIKALVAKGAKSPWLSRIKSFDPYSLNALTPERNSRGDEMVGAMPLILGAASAQRPWKLPPENARSHTGKNFWRWANPEQQKGPLTTTMITDSTGHRTELQLIPTIYIGDAGIAYSENISDVQKDGPFADIVVDASAGTEKVTAARGNGTVIALTRSAGPFRATLAGVADYEPISITKYGSGDVKQSTIEIDCVYRAAKSGAVIYHVRP